jgi:hypothetical protein
VFDEAKGGVPSKVGNIAHISRDQIVHAYDGVPLRQKAVTQVRSQEASRTSNQDSHRILPS